ncbi:MoaD/ThiS family protein [Desulfoplanes sp. PS50]
MQVDVQCFATLASYGPAHGSMDVSEGARIQELLEHLGVPAKEVRLVFVNGKVQADWSYQIQPGDRVGIFPPVGGG